MIQNLIYECKTNKFSNDEYPTDREYESYYDISDYHFTKLIEIQICANFNLKITRIMYQTDCCGMMKEIDVYKTLNKNEFINLSDLIHDKSKKIIIRTIAIDKSPMTAPPVYISGKIIY